MFYFQNVEENVQEPERKKVYSVYDVSTGKYIGFRTSKLDEDISDRLAVEGNYSVNSYYLEGEVIEKQTIPFTITKTEISSTNDADVATLGNLPESTVIKCDGEESVIHGGSEIFHADLPGEYTLVLEHPYHLTTEVLITVL